MRETWSKLFALKWKRCPLFVSQACKYVLIFDFNSDVNSAKIPLKRSQTHSNRCQLPYESHCRPVRRTVRVTSKSHWHCSTSHTHGRRSCPRTAASGLGDALRGHSEGFWKQYTTLISDCAQATGHHSYNWFRCCSVRMQLSCFCLPWVNLGMRLYKRFICKCSSKPLLDKGGEVTVNTPGSVLFPLHVVILQTIPLCICEQKFQVIL